jgi:hypothetical protein
MEAKKYCMRCGYPAQIINLNGIDACGQGCYEIIMITDPNKRSLYSDIEFGIHKLLGDSVQGVQEALDNIVGRTQYVKVNTYSRYYPEYETWVIELNKYQRDNLLWLFSTISGPNAAEPFTMANTGDWAGEIPYMLAKPGQSSLLDENDRPNRTIDDLKSYIESWVKSKK